MRETDVRQFAGRNDVTVEEVAEYFINKSQFIGMEKRLYQMKRIVQVCNLTEDDMNEVFKLIWGKVKIFEDKEGQRQRDWELEELKRQSSFESAWRRYKKEALKEARNETERKNIEEIYTEEKIEEKEKQIDYESLQKFAHYEEWLKMKGYV